MVCLYHKTRVYPFFLFALGLLLLSNGTYGQFVDPINDSLVHKHNIFDSDEPLFWSLTFDIRKFRKDKFKNEKLPAVLTYFKKDSVSVHKDIHIEARGVSRKELCNFPPIKLKFKKVSFDDPYLDQVKNQKLVTHCNQSKSYDQLLMKEYLVYKLYNVFTEQSFRVRLVKMNYIDSEKKVKTISRYAFLIEDVKVLADRNDCYQVKLKNLGMTHMDKGSMMQLSLFQFLVGNVDWSIPGLHNIKVLKSKDVSREYSFPVPYDFDVTGYVNASYATNVVDPEITSVKTRMFVGICFTEEEYMEVLVEFYEHKNEIYSIIKNFEYFDDKSRKEIIAYIDKFYSIVEHPKFYSKHIRPRCKTYTN